MWYDIFVVLIVISEFISRQNRLTFKNEKKIVKWGCAYDLSEYVGIGGSPVYSTGWGVE